MPPADRQLNGTHRQWDNEAHVVSNEMLADGYHKIGLRCFTPGFEAYPGQFVMVRLDTHRWPMLSRPFSIHRLQYTQGVTSGVTLLVKVIGPGTRALAHLAAGDTLQILGPVGNWFECRKARRIVLVAGGIGVAPLVFLAHSLTAQKCDPSQITVFLGGRTDTDILCRDDFNQIGAAVTVATEDGSLGVPGLVSQPLIRFLQQQSADLICACGPLPMLKAVARIARTHGIPCQVSIETLMACGMGACLGCALEKDTSGTHYLHACIDGPVFDSDRLTL